MSGGAAPVQTRRHRGSSKAGGHRSAQHRSQSHLMVPLLSSVMLELMMSPSVVTTLGHIFLDSKDGSSYRTGMFGRGQVSSDRSTVFLLVKFPRTL